ncbi:MAG: hypothetical protein ACFB0F_05525 [Neomegalonema sp.]
MITRLSEWWTRSCWGWLVVLGPVSCYFFLWIALDVLGLGGGNPITLEMADPQTAFREGDELILFDVAGKLEYAISGAMLLLVALFSLLWSLPRYAFAFRNPFGGATGLFFAVGLSGGLYWLYIVSPYELRQIFADDVLVRGEEAGLLEPWRLSACGFTMMEAGLLPSEAMARTRDVIYLVGNAATWSLIILAARMTSYEPKRYKEEPPEDLRKRLIIMQIAVLLAAGVIVLTVAYTRSMTHWPPKLLVDAAAEPYVLAATRYTALWGVLGTVLLLPAVAPAYMGLIRQFDRIANRELSEQLGRVPSFAERMAWRTKHGLLISAQQAMTTGAAVIAPAMTSPTLDATQSNQPGLQPNPPGQSQSIDQR